MRKLLAVASLFRDVAGRWVWSMILQIIGLFGLATMFRAEFLSVQYQNYTLGWLLSRWQLWVIAFLVLNFVVMAYRYHSYHSRIMSRVASQWGDRSKHLQEIGGYLLAGRKLQERGANLGTARMNVNFRSEVDDWRKGAESALQRINESHVEAFYRDSICQRGTPDENQFAAWMTVRLAVLSRRLDELQALPEELQSHSGGGQKLLNASDVRSNS